MRLPCAPLVLLLAGMLLSGCSFAAADSGVNVCQSNAECGEQEVCDQELSACVSRDRADYEVVLRVTAPATDTSPGSPPTLFGPFPIEESVSSRTLTVKGTRRVTGLLAARNGSDIQPLGVTLLITPRSRELSLDSETLEVTSSTEYLPSQNGEPRANFATTLRLETDYDIEVVPLADSSSQIAPRHFVVSAEEVASGHLELFYDALEPVSGMLLGAESMPLSNVSVRAVHPDTEEALSGRVVTGDGGDFELRVDTSRQAEGDVPWLLEVGPSAELPWFPTWRAGIEDTFFNADEVLVKLPPLPPLVSIELTVESEQQEYIIREVGGVTVTLSGELTLERADGSTTQASVSRSGITSAEGSDEGRLTLAVPAGEYRVVAVPPLEQAGLAPMVETGFRVVEQPPGTTQRGVTFTLPRRVRLRGTVTDASGRALSNISVQGVRLEPDDSLPAVAAFGRSVSTVTDLEGEYVLPLDVGAYDLIFEPSDGASYPWAVQPGLRIEGDEEPRRDVQLGAPVVLRGEVRFESGRSPAGALVSAFAEFEDDTYGARYLRLARTSVRDDGSYDLYLPGSL